MSCANGPVLLRKFFDTVKPLLKGRESIGGGELDQKKDLMRFYHGVNIFKFQQIFIKKNETVKTTHF